MSKGVFIKVIENEELQLKSTLEVPVFVYRKEKWVKIDGVIKGGKKLEEL